MFFFFIANIKTLLFFVLNFRIRTYEHESMWGRALTSYDLHSSLPVATRQVGIVEARTAENNYNYTNLNNCLFEINWSQQEVSHNKWLFFKRRIIYPSLDCGTYT